jgi:hypothetical protein
MRVSLTLGMMLFLIIAAPLAAQPKTEKARPTSRVILANLQHEVAGANFTDAMKFSEFLALARENLANGSKEVLFTIDDEGFKDEAPDALNVLEMEIRLKNLPAKTTVMHLLRQAVKQLQIKSAFVVRGGKVEIVTLARTTKEYMLNQTFHVDFSERKLDAALEELSELTGVSIVMDGRAKQKAQTPVTARFHDDVALQDAVRMLTDMAELKIVYLVTGMYITTPEHAKEMQKELKALYEPRVMPFGGVGVPGSGGPPSPEMFMPLESPLAPPLPPLKRRLDPAAAE